MWNSVKSILGSAAPMIGTLIGGPAGGLVGGMVASALGVENTPEAIELELKRNPDALLKLKQLESDEKIRFKELALDASKLALEERQSELKDVQHARVQHKDHWMPNALTIGLALMVGGMFISLFLLEPPERFDQVIIMIAGTVLGAFTTAVAFWLGSSKGSADKTKRLTGG